MKSEHIRPATHARDCTIGPSIRTLPEGVEHAALMTRKERPILLSLRAQVILGRGSVRLPLIEVVPAKLSSAATGGDDEYCD